MPDNLHFVVDQCLLHTKIHSIIQPVAKSIPRWVLSDRKFTNITVLVRLDKIHFVDLNFLVLFVLQLGLMMEYISDCVRHLLNVFQF